ncbi:unnamed protein product [Cyclocybe aegerita]|uniref:MYND-type domain-containing protein n=1 Tax=Cyclocybe aegerita TaxID=1973307 RepID=A0A8S0WDL6_CYCAE|nr:unnamed protein product [Cyclocybe aegerita]
MQFEPTEALFKELLNVPLGYLPEDRDRIQEVFDGTGRSLKCHNDDCPGRFDYERVFARERRKLMSCAGCETASYCSRECQRFDWPRHKEYCEPTHPQRRVIHKLSRNVRKHPELMLKLRIAIAFNLLDELDKSPRLDYIPHIELKIYLLPIAPTDMLAVLTSPDEADMIRLAAEKIKGYLEVMFLSRSKTYPPTSFAYKVGDMASIGPAMVRRMLDTSGNHDAVLVYVHFMYHDEDVLCGHLPIYFEDIYRARVLRAIKQKFPDIWGTDPMIQ